MTIKHTEKLLGSIRPPSADPSERPDRPEPESGDATSATLHAHPTYIAHVRELIESKMIEFRQARSNALDAIDQRIHELARLKHELDPAVAAELMVALAEARSILLSLNPTARESEKILTETSDKLRMLVQQRYLTASEAKA